MADPLAPWWVHTAGVRRLIGAGTAGDVYEDLTAHHPNGGSAKFLEGPMHSEVAAVAVVLAEGVRAALTL
jgi:hypothetical protein